MPTISTLAGSFQLYYKGPLAVQLGVYQGKSGTYGDAHFKNYAQRSIAHNTLLVYDPDELFTWHERPIRNEGGQRYPNDAHEPVVLNEVLQQGYKTGEVLAHAVGPDSIRPEFSYLKGELAAAYSSKVKSFKRSFVFLNFNEPTIPAALLVFDHVTSANKEFKKTWLLHTVQEPTVNGIYTTVKRTGRGYNGKLINTTLLPAANDLVIDKIGGQGKEYDVFGTNYPQAVADPATSAADSACDVAHSDFAKEGSNGKRVSQRHAGDGQPDNATGKPVARTRRNRPVYGNPNRRPARVVQ